jgi:uncharacterized membrane protein
MKTARLEAFSDGVLAIAITIMVLELKTPEGAGLVALRPLVPVFLSYVLSFVYVGIYWSNHHHLLHAATHVNGAVLWANLHLLFWLSLIPAVTAWTGAHPFAAWPAAFYGIVLLMAAIAYFVLERALIRLNGKDSMLARALGVDWKSRLSPVLYLLAICLAFARAWLAEVIYALVALIWIVPDRRIEGRMRKADRERPRR